MYYKIVGESENSHARYVFLNELCAGQSPDYIIDLMNREKEPPLRVDRARFHLALLGLPKHVYSGRYHVSTNEYMAIYVRFEKQMRKYLADNGYSAEIFLHLYGGKQIALMVSADRPRPRITPRQTVDYAHSLLQGYYLDAFLTDGAYCNQTYFCDRAIALDQLSREFDRLLALSKMNFFLMESIVLTWPELKRRRQVPVPSDMRELWPQISSAVNHLDRQALKACLDQLFLSHIKMGFDRYLVDEHLAYLKQKYIQHRIAYDLPLPPDVDAHFDSRKYPSIELLTEALIGLFDDCIVRTGKQELTFSPLVQKALRVLKTSYHKPGISLTYIADQIGVSPAYLSSNFNREMQVSIAHYIMTLRLERARELLLSGTMRVGDAAQAVGYDNKRYFSILFKKHFGIPPSDCRPKNDETPA